MPTLVSGAPPQGAGCSVHRPRSTGSSYLDHISFFLAPGAPPISRVPRETQKSTQLPDFLHPSFTLSFFPLRLRLAIFLTSLRPFSSPPPDQVGPASFHPIRVPQAHFGASAPEGKSVTILDLSPRHVPNLLLPAVSQRRCLREESTTLHLYSLWLRPPLFFQRHCLASDESHHAHVRVPPSALKRTRRSFFFFFWEKFSPPLFLPPPVSPPFPGD